MSVRLVLACAVAAALASCVRAQREAPRGALIEPAALGLSGQAAPAVPEAWWTAFGDPQLDRLIEEALAGNPSLDGALARVRESSAQVLAAGAARQPGVTLDADETWQRFPENYYIPPPFAGGRYWAGTAGANLSWMLDFWGRQAAVLREARATEAAAQLDVRAARLAVTAAVADAYLELDRAWALGDVAARTLGQREQLLHLTRQRVTAGLDASIDLNLAEARVADARNGAERATNARDLAVHRLAALMARGADFYAQVQRPGLDLDAPLPIPDALPIDLLAHRPDVLAARARVDAADAGRGAARAAFYPEVSLRAFVGLQAIGLDDLLESGSAIYGAGPTLRLPLFDAKRLRAAYRRATAGLDTAVAQYNATVLNAVHETADQLSLVDSLAKQAGEARRRLASAQAAYDLANQRYRAGLITQLVVLDADSEVLAARRGVVTLETGRALARINLLLTLGGSFHDGT
ncbi:MAG: efflux transporter outer membrane subunit [Steroidobacteraceae bacterium]